ncbi:glutamine-hydrolyzing carbamoyl-phosphate synthase small subunit [Thiopseudomonas alkaliphila]|uniref:glutamine-hydrolyzing carbamoyl-phosphate synthase small subunit n=1 Tax=Thiopseudomonas alkaliphila TaxID=1697053 RepID=UPI0025776BFA|nr:glutamine-hydrolyzing carbamoyl-phosphate synthase small subunit [Thiopseudomonas alkaliphila]MDM1706929.1 glutamine-hydrolyzing carbamoyl-phosphate synthase small subunit [Thiopseudomonas alkaliphila]
MTKPAILALADGSIFKGESIGIDGQTVGEVVFNTAMTGYQEILTDPSYAQQMVALTYPHIGNSGTTPEDAESNQVWAAGLIIRDLPLISSNWRDQQPLGEYLKTNKVVAIADIDTRRLTRILREKGALNGCILAGEDATEEQALALAQQFAGIQGKDLAREVSTAEIYEWRSGPWCLQTDSHPEVPAAKLPYHVVAYDFGVKRNILRLLVARGCRVTVVPAETPASEVLALNPDGVFLSNGPGDPAPCSYAVQAIEQVIAAGKPVFGICLGHQLLALASGARTEKLPNGHHGANHPVQDLATQRVIITSQNHGFAVAEDSLPANLRVTHRSLFDGTVQGVERTDVVAFGFQGHPEASPGPNDVNGLFDRFVAAMAK